MERNFARRIAWLSEFVLPGRILDVGTAYGFFLKAARAAGAEKYAREELTAADEAVEHAHEAVAAGDLRLALNHALGGLAPWGYHGLNLVIHLLGGLVLYGIVRRTFEGPG